MTDIESLLRTHAPRVLSTLVRRFGNFDACEDAVQEALLSAALQWPSDGVPDNPKGWLKTVATRRLIDIFRNEHARRHREDALAAMSTPYHDDYESSDGDSVALLFLCCHPALSPASQVALTLRAVLSVSTAEIARAFLVPESTIAQRIVRAKQRIRNVSLEMPPEPELATRIDAVLHVLYLLFNEGYAASAGTALHRPQYTREALRLARELYELYPEHGEPAGLLALMLLTDARRAARSDRSGGIIPLARQDRSLWNRDAIEEGVALVTRTLSTAPIGPYQLQAAIAAVHAEAPSIEATDWSEIVTLYDLLDTMAPGPMVTLNRIVAKGMLLGPRVALDLLRDAEREPSLREHHRLHAVRAHFLEIVGDVDGARSEYQWAARRTLSIPEQRYLEAQALRLAAL